MIGPYGAFKSTKSTLELTVVRTYEDLVRIITQLPDETGRCIDLAPSDAPALALAILEAAGVVHHDPDDTPYEKSERTENMGALNMSAFYLAKHVNDTEKAEFLAKEQAELEAEALELRNAYMNQIGRTNVAWDDMSEEQQEIWLAVARKARELAEEATK